MSNALYMLRRVIAGDRFYQALTGLTPERALYMLTTLEG